MSFLYKREDSPYYYAGFKVNGRWVRRSLGVTAKQAAAAKLRNIDQAMADGKPPFAEGGFNLTDGLVAYVEYCAGRNAPKTMLEKRRYAKRYEEYFGAARAISSISRADVERYVTDRLKSAPGTPTVNRELSTLKNFFNFAIEHGLCSFNPVRGIKLLPEKRRLPKILPYETLDKLFKWCLEVNPKTEDENDRLLYDIMTVAFNTGLRRGDVFKICGEDINIPDRVLTVAVAKRRGEKIIEIPLNNEVLEVLAGRKREYGDGFIFPGRGAAHIQDIRKRFAVALDALGEKFRFMELRHNFATRLIENGTDIYTLKELLGHEEIATTEKYLAVLATSKRRAVDKLSRRRQSGKLTWRKSR
jgi:site-specific recombinase XerD